MGFPLIPLAVGAGLKLLDSKAGKKAEIKTKIIDDPLKKAIATPLSEFLSARVGQGLPKFEGDLTSTFPEEGLSRFNEFLGLDSQEFFKERIADPATRRFREDFLPVVREGFAGSLRGSGRFRTEEDAINRFSEGLAGIQANLETTLPAAQFKMAGQLKAMRDRDLQVRYNAWLRELPEFNPVLQQSINFLNQSTSSGRDVLSALDPGKEGFLKDVIGMAGNLAIASAIGGKTETKTKS